jgi:hypothetical protein
VVAVDEEGLAEGNAEAALPPPFDPDPVRESFPVGGRVRQGGQSGVDRSARRLEFGAELREVSAAGVASRCGNMAS